MKTGQSFLLSLSQLVRLLLAGLAGAGAARVSRSGGVET